MVVKILNFIDHDPGILMQNISKNLEDGKNIVLDFYSLKSVNYNFLEESIGKVLDLYPIEKIQFKINFKNVDVGIREMLSKIINEKSV
jgi:hypothetical protein